MSRLTIENNDTDVLMGEDYVQHNGVEHEDDVLIDESFFNKYGRFDLSQALPNKIIQIYFTCCRGAHD
jgi:hypothetical protein